MAEYIEKAALLKHLHTGMGVIEMMQTIVDEPIADVKPVVRGEWELDSDKLPICSNCGEIALQRIFVKVPHLIQDVRMVRSNFCPNCGSYNGGDGDDQH